MNTSLKLLFKLLRRNINTWQIAGFFFANFIGGVIVLFGIQAYFDFKKIIETENDLLSEGYVCISKPISGLSTIGSLLGVHSTFSDDEINTLKEHPSVKDIGKFTTANFHIRGGFYLGEISISSDMFMESVPNRFIDVEFADSSKWTADIDKDFIPIIIPRKYLNIYNYGFATTKGLPQIGDRLSTTFPITLIISGNNRTRTYNARIVGFTDRLNTILVPENFLKEANKQFADKQEESPSRLIIATDTQQASNSFLEFLDRNGYIIDGDTENLKLQTLVFGILWIVIGIGSLVSLLAFFLLLISILLLIEKNKGKFINLHSIGYNIRQMSTPYIILVVTADFVAWIMAAIAVCAIYPQMSDFISIISPDLKLTSLTPLWVMALSLTLLFVCLHSWMIIRQLKKICQ